MTLPGDSQHEPAQPGRSAEIVVMALGGTIAMAGEHGVTPRLDGEDLISSVPGLGAAVPVRARSFRNMPGAHLGIDDVLELAAEIRRAFRDGARGVVVSQGTDTLEETAFALDVLLAEQRPVVVTGAMRHPAEAGADGPANLADAVAVASMSEVSGHLGVVVVLGGEIHSAQFVRKTHTVSPAAFVSTTGPLGWIAEGCPVVLMRPARRFPLPEPRGYRNASVALLTVAMGEDNRLIAAVKDLGFEGVVIEALGAGHVPADFVGPLEELAALMPVVLCSRTGRGPVLERTYGFPGSEQDLLARGLITGGHLDGPKARIALTLLLRRGADRAMVNDFFAGFRGSRAFQQSAPLAGADGQKFRPESRLEPG
ncbi:MAG: asparaginase [Streptosporangiaceae bacterium]